MPWSNQNGGGPWGGGGNKGGPWGGGNKDDNKGNKNPWGQKPGGGGGSGPNMPDMDEMLRRGQEKLKQFGGGGGGRGIAIIVVLLLAAFWLFQCFYVVQQNERAVELRFGVPKEGIVGDGLHFRIWPIESYRKIPLAELTARIGGREPEGLMLSSDQNLVNVSFTVYYEINDPAAFLFNVTDPTGTVQRVSESAMREVVGRRPVDDIYRDDLREVGDEVMGIIRKTLDGYQLGVHIKRVAIAKGEPPQAVTAAFNDVQQAEQERNRVINEGQLYANDRKGAATGEASRIRAEATAYKTSLVEDATGEAQRFKAVAVEAKKAPQETRFRIYLSAVQDMLNSPNKLILDKSASGAVPYLPLGELMRSGAGQKNSASPSTPAMNNATGGN